MNYLNIIDNIPHDLRRTLFSIINKRRFDIFQSKRSVISDNGYTFEPFDRYSCIFIHIPKAAGVSVSKALFGNFAGGHTKVSDYQLIFNKSDFERYFKFSFVRNPWDRVYSAYTFLIRGGMSNADRGWISGKLNQYNDFNEFVRNGLPDSEVMNWIHFIPQTHFLYKAGSKTLGVDFIAKFETLNDDFEEIRKRLVLPENVKLNHENPTLKRKESYLDIYNDESINIVADLYSDDVREFNYKFSD